MTEEEIKKLQHIPTIEVEQDLQDTEMEIKDYDDELQVLKRNPQLNKVRIYLLTGNISSRQQFCEKLKKILEYRTEKCKK